MKKSMLIISMSLVSLLSANTTTLYGPDRKFIEAASAVGVTQKNWDSGKSAKLTMQNAYRFTYKT